MENDTDRILIQLEFHWPMQAQDHTRCREVQFFLCAERYFDELPSSKPSKTTGFSKLLTNTLPLY